MTCDELRAILRECSFPDMNFLVLGMAHGQLFVQGCYDETDTVTGKMERQYTRQWVIPRNASKSEVVATAFKCCIASMEHRTREWFLYRNRAIYQPHYDVDQLHAICDSRPASVSESAR